VKGTLIGTGAYGRVYQGLDTKTGQMVAIKTIKFSGDQRKLEREVINIKQEIDLMKDL
jgi:serine/threonine protein kinase